jgi:hypothetical protein
LSFVKKYIIFAKATKQKNIMKYSELKNKINHYLEVGFTMQETKACIKDELRGPSRKTSKTADAIAAIKEKHGTAEYGWDGKEYGNRKWGKQS